MWNVPWCSCCTDHFNMELNIRQYFDGINILHNIKHSVVFLYVLLLSLSLSFFLSVLFCFSSWINTHFNLHGFAPSGVGEGEGVSVRERCESERETCGVRERQAERRCEREWALTVIETALASPLVSWVAGSVPACQPVCHHHCLVFSLRPSACSLYTGSCSGLTCFLYIDIFIATETSSFPPKNRGSVSLPTRHTLRQNNISWETFFILGDTVIWYGQRKQMTTMCFISMTKKRLIQ